MQEIRELTEMWISFGVGTKSRYIPRYIRIMQYPYSRKMQSFTIVSCPDRMRPDIRIWWEKQEDWSVWKTFNKLTDSLESVRCCLSPEDVKLILPTIERFVILLYDRGSTCLKVNEARIDLFTRKSRAIDAIPPTDDALNLHRKRSIYPGSFVWGQIMEQIQSLPSAADWGWKMGERTWEPLWTTLPSASKACRELIKCGCNTEISCKTRCKRVTVPIYLVPVYVNVEENVIWTRLCGTITLILYCCVEKLIVKTCFKFIFLPCLYVFSEFFASNFHI